MEDKYIKYSPQQKEHGSLNLPPLGTRICPHDLIYLWRVKYSACSWYWGPFLLERQHNIFRKIK